MTKIALLLFSGLCAAQSYAAATHSAVTPISKPEPGWKERALLLDERIKQTPDTQLLFIGDSITQGWEGAGKEVWEKIYALRKSVNLGISGDRTQHVLWRLQHAPLSGLNPKAAVVMIGTNNSNGEDNTAEQIADGVTAIVRTLREKLPETKVLLLGIFPRSENFSVQRGKLTQINQVLHKLDDGRSVFYLDIGHRFLTSEGRLPADIMPDYLHLSPTGYEIWGAAMEPKLTELLGGTTATASSSNVNASGKWMCTFNRPNEDPIRIALTLKAAEQKLTGTLQLNGERELPIENGSVDGDKLRFVVRRKTDEGGEAVHSVSGTVSGNEIKGKVLTEGDGPTETTEWSATRTP